MKKTMMLLGLGLVAAVCVGAAQIRENIEWSIGYGFHMTDAKKNLPRVLLVGDSICNAYWRGVQQRLEGKVNVSYWVSSYCCTTPSHARLLDFYLGEAKYDVIHFNNGLHSLGTDPTTWANSLRQALKTIRARQPQAKIVWCTSTPLKDPSKTAVVKKLNAVAAEVIKDPALGVVAVDDLFSLLDPLDRKANWSDVYHHKPPTVDKEAAQVAASVLKVLGK